MQAAASVSRPTQLGEQLAGQNVDGRYPLQRYLFGSSTHATFLTQIGAEQDAKAVVKLVLASSCDPEAQLAQWRRAAKLAHPNLLRILDGGRCWLGGNELIFLVSEYAEENLGEVLSRRALDEHETQTMLRPMISVSKYLQEQGLVHGRLSPANVMAAGDQLKLSSDCVRPAGEVKGWQDASPYDAPEIKSGKISSASDVWSLGMILTEALTGNSRAPEARKNLPKPFAEIVRYCLREDPASRWTLDQIEARLQGETVRRVAAEPPAPAETSRDLRRYLPFALGAILLIILAAIYGLVRHSGSREQGSVQQSVPLQSTQPSAAKDSSAAPAAAAANHGATGSVLRQVQPAASASSLRTIHGVIKVRVRVDVDPAGNVTGEKLISPGPSRYFSRLAMQAAQQWKFSAPAPNGQPASSQWTILFEYARSGITQQASPAP